MDIDQLVTDWAWNRKSLVFDTHTAVQGIYRRQGGHQSRGKEYRKVYRALCRLHEKGVMGRYHYNQHNPVLWWLIQRDTKAELSF